MLLLILKKLILVINKSHIKNLTALDVYSNNKTYIISSSNRDRAQSTLVGCRLGEKRFSVQEGAVPNETKDCQT